MILLNSFQVVLIFSGKYKRRKLNRINGMILKNTLADNFNILLNFCQIRYHAQKRSVFEIRTLRARQFFTAEFSHKKERREHVLYCCTIFKSSNFYSLIQKKLSSFWLIINGDAIYHQMR